MACLCYEHFDVVISLVDPETVLEWCHPRHHLFWVDDAEYGRRTIPDATFVDALLSVDLEGASSVLIHCHGGYSRSPAAAMLFARKLGTALRTIERGIDWTQADPNRLILALGETQLGLGRSLRDLAFRRTGRKDPAALCIPS